MILTVGTGTAGRQSNIAEGLIAVLIDSSPDIVCLVPSSAPESVAVADLVAEGLEEAGVSPSWIRAEDDCWFALTDPDDIWLCRNQLVDIIQHCRDAWPEGHIVLNPTSGTKQMTAAAVLAGLDMRLEQLQFIGGIRRDGVVATGTEKPLAFSALGYVGEHAARQAAATLQLGAYAAAIEIIRPFADVQPDLFHFAQTLQLWHRMDYIAAFREAQLIHASPSGWRSVLDRLRRLQARTDSILHAVDLYLAAARLTNQGDFEEALGRLYRMMEMIAKIRMHEEYELTEPYTMAKLPKEMIPPHKWTQLTMMRRDDNVLILGMVQLYEMLGWFADPLGEMFTDDFELLRSLQQRNASYIGHSRKPVAQDAVNHVLDRSRDYLRLLSDEADHFINTGKFPDAEGFIRDSGHRTKHEERNDEG